MKGLKKIALVTAIAAAPFAAHADLKAMDDSAMGNITGQAGVTIELETQVSIGTFTYTDEGSFNVNDIVIGGSGVGGGTGNNLLDDLKIDIDVEADGDAFIHVGSITGAPIDWGLDVGSMTLSGTEGTTTLISNLSGHGNLAQLDIRVDTATDALQLDVAFDVTNMDFDVEFLGVGIVGMSITGAGGNFDYDGDGMEMAVDADGEFGLDPTSKEAKIMAGFANANLNVYKGSGLGDPSTAKQGVLRIDVENINMDVNIAGVEIGGTSIGSLAIDNLAITNTKLAVYGH